MTIGFLHSSVYYIYRGKGVETHSLVCGKPFVPVLQNPTPLSTPLTGTELLCYVKLINVENFLCAEDKPNYKSRAQAHFQISLACRAPVQSYARLTWLNIQNSAKRTTLPNKDYSCP